MTNPWKKNNSPNFYFEEDAIKIEEFNKSLGKHPHYIDLELMPEPYIGNPKANVILLLTNPGIKGIEKLDYKKFPGLEIALEKNLTHDNPTYPYYYLNPEFAETAGGKWFRKRTKELIKIMGDKELSEKIFTIQLHPYHSNEYREFKEPFFAHNYSMFLLSKAISRKALIIFSRSHDDWNSAYNKFDNNVKELKNIIENYIELKTPIKNTTPRSPFLIESYMGGSVNFNNLISKLKEPLPKYL